MRTQRKLALAFATVWLLEAQSGGVQVTVDSVPDGALYQVDGQIYRNPTAAVWPVGSAHVLAVDPTVQIAGNGIQYLFKDWEYTGGTLPGNPVTVTASPAFPAFHAVFKAQYALTLSFFECSDPAHCASSGTVYVNGTPYTSSQTMYLDAGSSAVITAVPNSGYVFGGFVPAYGQEIQGFMDTVTMSQPQNVHVIFQVARSINIATVPQGLQVLADHSIVTAPTTLQWGWDSTHTVGPVSPQQDISGKVWIFASWSDGGAANHTYQVPETIQADTLTATYVPGASVTFLTSPPGLQLQIDGRSNWPSYFFAWGIGETHQFVAPAQQKDAQGRLWEFSSWSNGGAAAQTITVPEGADTNGMRFTATYHPMAQLTVNSSQAGLAVTVNGVSCATPCTVEKPVGTQVDVNAPASVPIADGSRADFLGWPGMTGDWVSTLGNDPVTISANYHTMNRLTAASDPAGDATWSFQPASADGFYDAQTSVAVRATAKAGYRFRAWSGDLSGSSPGGTVAMSSPRSVVALLDRVPYIAPAGVANAAGGANPQAGVAPGSIISIFGASLAAATATGPAGPLAQTLGGVTVRMGDALLPLYFVSPMQINAQLPPDAAPGAQTLTVSGTGQPDVIASFTVAQDAPGIFSQTINGQAFALALHADGSLVTPDAPASQGELITVYGTGFGATNPPRPFGLAVPASPPMVLVDPVTVQVGSDTITPENAFAAPGSVGMDAVQFRLDGNAPTGMNAQLTIAVNGQSSNSVLLACQ